MEFVAWPMRVRSIAGHFVFSRQILLNLKQVHDSRLQDGSKGIGLPQDFHSAPVQRTFLFGNTFDSPAGITPIAFAYGTVIRI